MNETLVRLGGVFCIGFVIFHLAFWRLFDWRRDLASLSFLNRAVMQVLNLCLTFAFVIFAVVSLLHTEDLLGTDLGRTLLALIAAFWIFRAVLQPVFFKLRRPLSVAFFLVFVIGGLLYAWPLLT